MSAAGHKQTSTPSLINIPRPQQTSSLLRSIGFGADYADGLNSPRSVSLARPF
ncbi:protein of unknown function [Stenotrophomonas maltophilia]|nr:protein of unknown function [Stenotrophomonas maltophilia]